jgi:hypothetical protein
VIRVGIIWEQQMELARFNSTPNNRFLVYILALILLILPVFLQPAHASGVTLAWDANTEASVTGYKVSYGTGSSSYSSTVDVGNWTSVSITGLDTGRKYYFACKAYNAAGTESGYSSEISYTTPAACTYSIAPASQSFSSPGGSGSVTVTTQAGCAWSASSSASWVSITAGASLSGPGTVSYSVAANTATASRSAAMTIAGNAFTVSQQGAAAANVTITSSAGSGGSISPSGTVTVSSGSSKTFTITPRWFYAISSVKVNGVSVGAVKTYTFSNVRQNQTISATFRRKY